jgi:hypothetical protein
MMMQLLIDFQVGDVLGSPKCKIMIDDYLVLHEGNAVDRFYQEVELSAGWHELKIVHFGKTDRDHVYNMDGTIGIDKYIQIYNIQIDTVKLLPQELQQGKFWPVYSDSYLATLQAQQEILPLYISPNLYLGHNGTWRWDFYHPFVPWIIEQRRPGLNLSNTVFRSSQATLDEAKYFFSKVRDI